MTPAYLTHFGFDQVPFSADADLWLPPSKEAVVHELQEAVDEHASVILTGEPGAAKTCVLRALRHRLPQAERVHPVLLLDEAHLLHQDRSAAPDPDGDPF